MTVKTSLFKYGRILAICFLLCWLIVPAVFFVYYVLKAKSETLEFKGKTYVIKEGIFSKSESQRVLTDVLSVQVNQTLGGRIFRYGTVYARTTGNLGFSFEFVKNPQELKAYLDNLIADTDYEKIGRVLAN